MYVCMYETLTYLPTYIPITYISALPPKIMMNAPRSLLGLTLTLPTYLPTRSMFGDDAKKGGDLARIVSERHAQRMADLLADKPGKVGT